jgi:hypothetical protein
MASPPPDKPQRNAPVDRGDASEVSADNPFPGLRAFEEADEKYFRGRRAESEDLVRRIKRAGLTTCYGVSGLGKSSLLKAGVFPKLRRERYCPVVIRLSFHESAADFVTQLKAQTVKQAKRKRVDVTPYTEEETLWEYFHRAEFWDEWNNLLKPVIVLDQFEEMLRKEIRKDERVQAFLTQLGDLIENRIPASERKRFANMDELPFQLSSHHYRVVIALREEALPDLEQRMGDIPSIRHNRMRLLPMSGPAAMEVVRQNPNLIDERVAREVVRFIAAGDPDRDFDELEIEPAYLSVFCRELNRERIEKGETKITLDRLMVSRDEILSEFYERTLGNKKYGSEVRHFIEERLITKSGHRASVAKDDVLGENITEEDIRNLEQDRLIRVEERSGTEQIELTHDLLTGVIRESRDKRRAQETIQRVRRQRLISAGIAALSLLIAVVIGYQYFDNRRLLAETEQKEAELRQLNEVNNTQNQFIKKTTDAIAELALSDADPNLPTIRLLRGLRNALVANSGNVIAEGLKQTDGDTFVTAFVNALTSDDPRLVDDALDRIVARQDPALVANALDRLVDEISGDLAADTMTFAEISNLTAARRTLIGRIEALENTYGSDYPELAASAAQVRQNASADVAAAQDAAASAFLRDIAASDVELVREAIEAAESNQQSIQFLQVWDPRLSPRLLEAARDVQDRFQCNDPDPDKCEAADIAAKAGKLRLNAGVMALQSSRLSPDARRDLRNTLGDDFGSSPVLVEQLLQAAEDPEAVWHAFDILARKTTRSAWNNELLTRAQRYFTEDGQFGLGDDTKTQIMLLRVHLATLGLIPADSRLVNDVIATFEFDRPPSDYQSEPLLEFLDGRNLTDAQRRRLAAARG